MAVQPTSRTPRTVTPQLTAYTLRAAACILCICATSLLAQAQPKLPKKLPKTLRPYFEHFKLVADTSTVHTTYFFNRPLPQDTSRLFYYQQMAADTHAFLMCDHEVTNSEYRRFSKWVQDSVVRTYLAKHRPAYYANPQTGQLNYKLPINKRDTLLRNTHFVRQQEGYYRRHNWNTAAFSYALQATGDTVVAYPDTLCWWADFGLHELEPTMALYTWHPGYNNYPVVGVSYYQALAYCEWQNKRFAKAARAAGIQPETLGHFRLPTEAEWLRAALVPHASTQQPKGSYAYPWKGYTATTSGQHRANYGFTVDKHGVIVHGNADDGAYGTEHVHSFGANQYGLYNLSGNVAEWTTDTFAQPDSLYAFADHKALSPWVLAPVHITDTDAVETVLQKLITANQLVPNSTDSTHYVRKAPQPTGAAVYLDATPDNQPGISRYHLHFMATRLLHDWHLTRTSGRKHIVKGGSWPNAPAYLMCASREVFPPAEQHSTIGFRLVFEPAHGAIPLLTGQKGRGKQ